MARIYTKTGDKGMTGTYAGERIPKDDPRIIIGGQLDALQAGLDMALLYVDSRTKDVLVQIQSKLWQTAGELSLCGLGKEVKNHITEEDIAALEQTIDAYGPPPTKFIRFTTQASVFLNEARVRCRALESALTAHLRAEHLRPVVYTYLNRLSDLLFIMAYAEERTISAQ